MEAAREKSLCLLGQFMIPVATAVVSDLGQRRQQARSLVDRSGGQLHHRCDNLGICKRLGHE